MPLALCCMSHSPLLNLPGPSRDLLDDVDAAIAQAREFVEDYDPELVVIFSPDHYNGFFYKAMPPFCIGLQRQRSWRLRHPSPARSTFPRTSPRDCAEAVLGAGVDVAVSASMDVDHGTVQPLEKLFGDATSRPVIPIFINAIAVPLGPLHRCRALGTAVGSYLADPGQAGPGDRIRWALAQSPGADAGDRAARGPAADRARRTDDVRAAASPADRRDGGGQKLRRRRERPATPQPGVGSPLPGDHRRGTARRVRLSGRTRSCSTRAAAPRMKSERG